MATGPLAGRLALVTGASRGIGAAVAAGLSADGATVVRAARSLRPGRQEGKMGGTTVDVAVDLATDQGVEAVAEAVLAIGIPDILVSNAGAFGLGALEAATTEDLDHHYRINLRAPFALARTFLPKMRERRSGRHILIGSVADHQPFPGNAVYAATKFGARGLHEVLRAEYRGTGVLCTLVSPGPVDTPMWDPIDPESRPGFTPRASMLKADDVASLVRWIAGQPPRVDVAWVQLGPA